MYLTEQEILLIMTIMALLDKPVTVQKAQETYLQQKRILATVSEAAESAPGKNSLDQKGVRIIGMRHEQ